MSEVSFQDILDEDDEPVVDGGEVAETPETPEPPAEPAAPEPPPAVEPSAPEPALPEGYKRDEKGRVHRPDGTIASKDELAVLPPASPPIAPPAAAPAVAPAAPGAVGPVPFVFRASGRKIPLEGATLAPDGSLMVPPNQVATVRQLFAAGVQHNEVYPAERKQFETRIAQAEAAAKAGGQKYNDASLYLYDKIQTAPDWFLSRISDPNVREQLAQEWNRELGYITKDVQHILKEADLAAPRVPEPVAPDDTALEQAARSALAEEVEDLLDATPNSGTLYAGEGRAELLTAFQARLNAYVTEVDGQLVIDRHALKADFDREVKLQSRAHQQADQARRDAEKAKAAAAFNAANGTTPAPSTPRRPSPALAAAPSGAPAKTWDQRVSAIFSDDEED